MITAALKIIRVIPTGRAIRHSLHSATLRYVQTTPPIPITANPHIFSPKSPISLWGSFRGKNSIAEK